MKRILLTTAAFGLAAGMAQAGGVERSHSPYAILWETGNYAELTFGYAAPDVSGSAFGASSGDMAGNYTQFGLGLKYAINDRLDVAVVLDQPIGADIAYPAGTTYPLTGSTGTIDSTAITALARYKFDGGFSVHGGIKVERTKGAVALPTIFDYSMTTSTETDLGYLIGAAYEKPEIALRVALTYQSAIKHDFDATEVSSFGTFNTAFETEVPQSVTLDFQSGVAKDTLVFGSVRWRDWTAFDITPPHYATPAGLGLGALVEYPKDVVTWTLGVGRRFNENFSGAISFGYEDPNGLPTGNLGPHDGMKSVTLGGSYTKDNMKITAGVSYIKIGDATTNLPPGNGLFTDNDAVGFGMKIGYSF